MSMHELGRLAEEHRRELLRVAVADRLAAGLAHERDGLSDRALLLLASALARGAERARIRYAHRRLARLHRGMTGAHRVCPAGVDPICISSGGS